MEHKKTFPDFDAKIEKQTVLVDSDGIEYSYNEIDQMLTTCSLEAHGGGSDFIDSLEAQWYERGYLSPRQIDALLNFVDRIGD